MRWLLAIVFVLGASLAWGHPADTFEFQSVEAQRRAMTLSRELRCPQCQNQNLMESNSAIAQDLRLEVYKLVDGGKSDEAVITYMTERFGDFVRYNPPFKATTALLWSAPVLLLLFAVWMLARLRIRSAGAEGTVEALSETVSAPVPPCSAASSVPLRSNALVWSIIAGTTLAVWGGYGLSGRWQEAMYWQDNPNPIIGMTAEELKITELQRLKKLLDADPRDLGALAQAAGFYAREEDFDAALAIYDHIAKLEGSTSAATAAAKATVLYYQARRHLSPEASFTPEVRNLVEQALAKDPGDVNALILLATDHFNRGQHREAVDIWQKLLDQGRPGIDRRSLIRDIQAVRSMSR